MARGGLGAGLSEAVEAPRWVPPFSGTPALLGSLQGLGAAPDTGWVPGRKGAFAGLDRVLTGGWRTHCRWAANLTCIF